MTGNILSIVSSRRSYGLEIAPTFSDLSRLELDKFGRRTFYIADANVWKQYHLKSIISSNELKLYNVSSNTKQLSTVVELLEDLCSLGLKKNDQLVVIGGATLQDLCGTAAGLFHRGIDWIYIPTTLLAQGDSCIGSKTSIDSQLYKNQFGLFNPPAR